MKNNITVKSQIKAPVQKVWRLWTQPEHIKKWNNASDDWHTTKVDNDLRKSGKFSYRMESKDGQMGFDFEGTYNEVKKYEKISYSIADGRKVVITFKENSRTTLLEENFQTEKHHPEDQQRQGWQAILDNFKNYVEAYEE